MNTNTLTLELLGKMDAYWRAAMTVLNDLDRFDLVMVTIDRLPQTGKPVYTDLLDQKHIRAKIVRIYPPDPTRQRRGLRVQTLPEHLVT